jgi:hypothetical protein
MYFKCVIGFTASGLLSVQNWEYRLVYNVIFVALLILSVFIQFSIHDMEYVVSVHEVYSKYNSCAPCPPFRHLCLLKYGM